MIKSLEFELRGRAPLSYFDIVVFIFSERHTLVENVGKIHEKILDLLPCLIDSCLETLDLLRNDLGLFHQCRSILFLLSRLGDCRRNLVSFPPQLISFCLKAPPLSIELQEEIHLVPHVRHAPLPQALLDYLGVLSYELDVQQDRFAPNNLPVGKKTNVPLGCAKTFQGRRRLPNSVLELHQHDVVYFGVVNLIDNGYVMGSIDVWKCRSCPQTFCEDKRFGMTDLAPEVGLPKIEPGSKWAAIIQPSRYNVLNLTSILFIVSGVSLGLQASFSLANPTVLGVLAILAVAVIASGIFLQRPKLWPATLGLVAVATAFAAQLWIQFTTGLTASETALDILLVAAVVAGWLSWSRVRSLRAKQWHPLDMPAYG